LKTSGVWCPAVFLLLGYVSTCPGLSQAALEGGKWYRYNSRNFEVYSKLRQGEVAERIRDLEAFRAVVHEFVVLEDRGNFGHTTKILLLPSIDALRKTFKLRHVAGFMRSGLRANLMVVGKPRSTVFMSENSIVFHEYVHYLVRNASSFQYPTWYDEGFAEVLATVTIEDDHATLGAAPPSAAYTLLNRRDMSLDRVVGIDSTSDLKVADRQKFYARAWLLTHYLSLSAAPGMGQKLLHYLNRFNEGGVAAEAFEESFELSFDALDSSLEEYTHALPAYRVPLQEIDFEPNYARVSMTPSEVGYQLGYMTAASNPSYARKLFSRILKTDPDNARALAGLGVSHQYEGEFNAAEKWMRKAIALDGNDYVLLIELADLLMIACRARVDSAVCEENQTNKEAVDLYRRSYALKPDSLEALTHYGTALITYGQPGDAVNLLKQASELAPWSYTIVRSLGSAYAADAHWDEAKVQLRKALGWSVDHPEEQARLRALLVQVEMAAQLEERRARQSPTR
jgi:tetratricopeptide (TPR) repeat protein